MRSEKCKSCLYKNVGYCEKCVFVKVIDDRVSQLPCPKGTWFSEARG